MSPKIICLTPVKNEEWILRNFLRATSLWADKIVVVFQKSDDNSEKICKEFSKVVFVRNDSDKYDEFARQNILINESRKIFPDDKHILIALDADEFLTMPPSFELEIKKIVKLKVGTNIIFNWNNVKSFGKEYWEGGSKMPFGFVDDGRVHQGKIIHSNRVPINSNIKCFECKEIQVLHYQYANWDRMRSKHRWYQAWEAVNHPERSYIDIFRQYNHMYGVNTNNIKTIPEEWFHVYSKNHIDINEFAIKETVYWWDKEVIGLIKKYSKRKFSKIYIWDFDWTKFGPEFSDPRSVAEKLIHIYLFWSQKYLKTILVKIMDKIIKLSKI